MLDLFPDTATIAGGELRLGGVGALDLAERFGTPLLVLCERTLRARARAYVESAGPRTSVVYGTKALPLVEVMRVLAGEGVGADVSTLGELRFAQAAGLAGPDLVVHGNNKSDEELREAAAVGARYVVLDAPDEVARAAAAGVERVLVRVTPGIDADTHDAIKTGHHGSKFGLPPEDALVAIAAAREAGLDVAGVHVHIGSQLLELAPIRYAVDWAAGFAAEARRDLGWTARVLDVGGGLGVAQLPDDPRPRIEEFVRALEERVARAWELHGLPPLEALVLEPGRSLVGTAGVSLYRVGAVKRASEAITYVAVDGGMSDNPRPQLYGARYVALLANRADEEPGGAYAVCGKHCESGDVLIDRVALPEPRRGDLLAVPATGAYTLGMASNYNLVPRPAAVLVADGAARVVRRRETIADLLALEA